MKKDGDQGEVDKTRTQEENIYNKGEIKSVKGGMKRGSILED
jgi:hypothetical protein